jgi:ABC-type multidrug transport system fused ATPase/permease subunit
MSALFERLILESLEKLSVDLTMMAIAHRLSTIVQPENIVVLEKVKTVEQETYQKLIDQHAILWTYHQMQSRLKQSE